MRQAAGGRDRTPRGDALPQPTRGAHKMLTVMRRSEPRGEHHAQVVVAAGRRKGLVVANKPRILQSLQGVAHRLIPARREFGVVVEE